MFTHAQCAHLSSKADFKSIHFFLKLHPLLNAGLPFGNSIQLEIRGRMWRQNQKSAEIFSAQTDRTAAVSQPWVFVTSCKNPSSYNTVCFLGCSPLEEKTTMSAESLKNLIKWSLCISKPILNIDCTFINTIYQTFPVVSLMAGDTESAHTNS